MSSLPDGWTMAPIGLLCELANGRAFRTTDWSDLGLPIVRIQNLNNPEASFHYYNGEVEVKIRVADGDLLFAWSGTPGTSFGAHLWNRGPAVLNQHIFKVVFDRKQLNPEFFRYAINQRLQDFMDKAHGGAGLRHLTRSQFEATPIAIAPRLQQDRIVSRLCDLRLRTARARSELIRVQSLLGPYRRAILATAFSERFITASTPMRPLADLVDPDRGIPYGIVQTAQPTKRGIPTVRAGDIKNFTILKTGLKQVDPKISAKYQRTLLRGGEVLISIRGTVGNAAVATKELSGCNLSREVAMIPITDELNPWFLTYFLSSPLTQDFILRHVKGVAQSGINLRDLRVLPVPVLEIQAQDRIVHFVDEAFGWLTSVQKDSLHALSGLTSLNEAILAKAFRGELVAPDPTDLSGTELLARIATWKAMRAEQPSRDESRPAPESKSPPNKTKEVPMGKRRTDVGEKYLTDILSRMGGVSDASALWQRSEMDIDEFYKQLRAEVQAGLIREQAEKGRLVRTNAT